jgi:hypothetical protein
MKIEMVETNCKFKTIFAARRYFRFLQNGRHRIRSSYYVMETIVFRADWKCNDSAGAVCPGVKENITHIG